MQLDDTTDGPHTTRRNVLKAAGSTVAGLGGVAANGTAAANSADKIRVYSTSNSWEYQVIIDYPNDGKVEKGYRADEDDSILGWEDHIVNGQVSEGEGDNYWMDSDDSIERIRVTYNDYGYLNINVASETSINQKIGLRRDRNPDWPGYGYTIDVNGDMSSDWRHFDPDQDSISGGTFSGTIDPKDIDAAIRSGSATRVFIEDPDSPGSGLIVNLPD